jgi:hypothetical protein
MVDYNDYKPNPIISSNSIITEGEVINAQKTWGDGLILISKTYDEKGYEEAKKIAQDVLNSAYGYAKGVSVLFKPTLASGKQTFRLTNDGALAYFVGGIAGFPDAQGKGFACKGWREVKSYPAGIQLFGNIAHSMGNVHLIDKDGKCTIVDKTWGYKKDDEGNVRIVLHHSSLPYMPPHVVLKFDGVGSVITSPSSLMNNLLAFTLEGWVKAVSLRDHLTSFFGQNDVIEFGTEKGCYRGHRGQHPFTSQFFTRAPAFPLHEWHHVALVATSMKLLLYHDGVLVSSADFNCDNYGDSAFPFQIGAGVWHGGKTHPFHGFISDVRLWTVARSQAEIQAYMSNRLTGKEPNLKAYYPLDKVIVDGNTTKVLDLVDGCNALCDSILEVEDSTLPLK